MKRQQRIGSVYLKRGGTWEAAIGSGESRSTHRVASEADGWIWCAQEYARRVARTYGAGETDVTPATERLADRFTESEIEERLAASDYSPSSKSNIRRAATWIRTACADLLTVAMPQRYGEEKIVKRAIAQIVARRAAPAPDLKTASPLIQLVGRWEARDGALLWNGAPVSLRSTAPRLVSIADGVNPAEVDLGRQGCAAAALARLAEEGAPMTENALGRDAVRALVARGLVTVAIQPVKDARSAILALMERSPRREAEIGIMAARTLIAKRYAVRHDATGYALHEGEISSTVRAYLNATIALAVAEEGGVTWLPKRSGRGERRTLKITNLAAMSGAEEPVEADLRALLAHLVASAEDGDAIDRLLALEAALGLRQPEARGLNVGDLDGDTLTIRRNRTEDGDVTSVKSDLSNAPMSLPPKILAIVRRWCAGRDARESLIGAERLTNRAIVKRRAQRIREIGLRPTLDANDLRHLAATLLEEAGASRDEVRRFLRHESDSTATKRYTERMKRTVPAQSVEMILGS